MLNDLKLNSNEEKNIIEGPLIIAGSVPESLIFFSFNLHNKVINSSAIRQETGFDWKRLKATSEEITTTTIKNNNRKTFSFKYTMTNKYTQTNLGCKK